MILGMIATREGDIVRNSKAKKLRKIAKTIVADTAPSCTYQFNEAKQRIELGVCVRRLYKAMKGAN